MFEPVSTDYTLSTFTGFTRETWIEAGKYLLSGVFADKKSIDEPALVKRQEFDVTYPHLQDGKYPENQVKAELFEGLTRTIFIAAPLIKNDRDVRINGFNLAEYYRHQIVLACDPASPNYIGTYDELREMTHQDGFAFRPAGGGDPRFGSHPAKTSGRSEFRQQHDLLPRGQRGRHGPYRLTARQDHEKAREIGDGIVFRYAGKEFSGKCIRGITVVSQKTSFYGRHLMSFFRGVSFGINITNSGKK